MTLNTEKDLLVHELQEAYNSKTQLLDVIPLIAESTIDNDLTEYINVLSLEADVQKDRLAKISKQLNVNIDAEKSFSMEGLLAECRSIAFTKGDQNIINLQMSRCLLRAQSYLSNVYDTLAKESTILGYEDAYKLILECIKEENTLRMYLKGISR